MQHLHDWVDDAVQCFFRCKCGARVSHETACVFLEASGRMKLTTAILNQLSKATAIVAD